MELVSGTTAGAMYIAPGYTALEGVSLSSFWRLPAPDPDRNLQLLSFLGLCLRYSDSQHPMLLDKDGPDPYLPCQVAVGNGGKNRCGVHISRAET